MTYIPSNPDAKNIKIGDRVTCIFPDGSPLEMNKEYTVIDITVSDVLLDGVYQTWDKNRFKISRKRKGLAPGLTLVDLRGRKGVAPELNV